MCERVNGDVAMEQEVESLVLPVQISQLMNLTINTFYVNKEILPQPTSNGSVALEKIGLKNLNDPITDLIRSTIFLSLSFIPPDQQNSVLVHVIDVGEFSLFLHESCGRLRHYGRKYYY